ncbi:MAG: methoxyneurosporene dehydrogenase, partial [Pseudomonadota bacterium]
ATERGARFEYGNGVREVRRAGKGFEVIRDSGQVHSARKVLFNGDPAALHHGLLGRDLCKAVELTGVSPRSLSAWVWSFAATPTGRDLAHHNVFFNEDYRREFDAIAKGAMPDNAALYVCAQDRSRGIAPGGPERFEIILNAPPVKDGHPPPPRST